MSMSEGQLKSLAVVAQKLREQEAPLRERGDPSGLGIGAAALLVEMAGDEIRSLRAVLGKIADGRSDDSQLDAIRAIYPKQQ